MSLPKDLPLPEALAQERPVEAVSEDFATGAPDAISARRRGFSLLRASVGERLSLVAAVLLLLWLSVYWALQ